MPYRVHRYINQIKYIDPIKISKGLNFNQQQTYVWFDSYEDAKQWLINRCINQIAYHQKQVDAFKKKLPKIEAMKNNYTK